MDELGVALLPEDLGRDGHPRACADPARAPVPGGAPVAKALAEEVERRIGDQASPRRPGGSPTGRASSSTSAKTRATARSPGLLGSPCARRARVGAAPLERGDRVDPAGVHPRDHARGGSARSATRREECGARGLAPAALRPARASARRPPRSWRSNGAPRRRRQLGERTQTRLRTPTLRQQPRRRRGRRLQPGLGGASPTPESTARLRVLSSVRLTRRECPCVPRAAPAPLPSRSPTCRRLGSRSIRSRQKVLAAGLGEPRSRSMQRAVRPLVIQCVDEQASRRRRT